jgi:hypothetical protein
VYLRVIKRSSYDLARGKQDFAMKIWCDLSSYWSCLLTLECNDRIDERVYFRRQSEAEITEGLSIIGRTSLELLIENLKWQAMDLKKENRTYSLPDLERLLGVIFGNEAVSLILERTQI